MAKRWKKEDATYLKRYAAGKRLAELADRFKTDNATIEAKLEELGLAAKDSVAPVKIEHDASVKVFEKGVRALHKGKWKEARDIFEQVIAETEFAQVAQSARRFAALAASRLEAPAAADDPFLEAVYERNQGNLDKALDLSTRGGRQGKDERFAYLAASIYALQGDNDKAASALETAIGMNPKNRIHAYYDADFAELRKDQEYGVLFEQSSG